MEYNSGNNQASNFKITLSWFEITSMITPESYDTEVLAIIN